MLNSTTVHSELSRIKIFHRIYSKTCFLAWYAQQETFAFRLSKIRINWPFIRHLYFQIVNYFSSLDAVAHPYMSLSSLKERKNLQERQFQLNLLLINPINKNSWQQCLIHEPSFFPFSETFPFSSDKWKVKEDDIRFFSNNDVLLV